MDELDSGRLIWLASVIDQRGVRVGPHRAVVLTPKGQIASGEPIRAVIISSKPNYAPRDEMVEIPWKNGGHPQTGCDRPSFVIGSWTIEDVDVNLITERGNLIYGRLLREIAACVKSVQAKRQAPPETES